MSRSDAALKRARRLLYFGHRWSGIILCLFFAVWFVSGVVMMYVPFPSFRAPERIAGAPPIDWAQVRVGPGAVLGELGALPDEMRLEMSGGRPVYRIVTSDGRIAIGADTGGRIGPVDAGQARRIASAFGRAPAVSVDLVARDQWVITRAFARQAPFWRVRLGDGTRTDLYVARATGEIVQNTNAHERFWNWLGAVPHWIYFSALRVHQEPWRQVVLWTSGIGMLGAVAGIWIGLLRVRIRRRYRSGAVTPYRGWMKWHHVIGLVGGLFLVTWVFSGWLSMSPWGGFHGGNGKAIAARYAGDRPGFPQTDVAALARSAAGAREVRFGWLGGHPVMEAWYAGAEAVLLDGATARRRTLSTAEIAGVARSAMPGAALASVTRMDRYDRYWYDTGDPRNGTRALPVLRLVFDDPRETWLHIAPGTGELPGQSDTGSRTYRWLFNALHSFDLPLLLEWRPLRDGLMWLLSASGLAISISGIVIGWRRLRPRMKRPIST